MTAFERRAFRGAAAAAELAVDPGSSGLTVTLTAPPIGWPDGSDGPFIVTIDAGGTEEKIRVVSRSGGTLTLSGASDRGIDGTVGVAHNPGVTVKHTFSARDADEANYAVSQLIAKILAKGDLVVGSGANTGVRVPVGAVGLALVADPTTASGVKWAVVLDPSSAQTLLNKTLDHPLLLVPAIADLSAALHDHQDNPGGGPLAQPVILDFTGALHDHKNAAGGGQLDHPTILVPTIADLTNMQHNHGTANKGGTIPFGSVTGLPGWTDYTPVWTGTTTDPSVGGAGSVKAGRWYQVGKLTVVVAQLTLGSGFNIGSGTYDISVPVAARNGSVAFRGVARYGGTGAVNIQGGVATIGPGASAIRIEFPSSTAAGDFNTFASGGFPASNFAVGDTISAQVTYEAA